MTPGFREPQEDALAKQLAELDRTTVAEAVITALKEAIATRTRRESAREAARRIIREHGLKIADPGKPVAREVYDELDPFLNGH